MDWKAVVEQKRIERQSRLPTQWLVPENELPSDDVKDVTTLCAEKGWLSKEELFLTEASITSLAAGIGKGDWTAETVVKAFAHRATIAQQLINPLTEIRFEEAIKEAKKLDEHFTQTGGGVVGPLHGIPISVKDMVHVEGLDTTMGFCAWAGQIATEDAVVVTALRKAGAIVLCKTNIGHTLMMGEAFNNIWGRTLNPYNRTLTSGGSSGGESALLAFRGTPIGIGTDIGGSIRMPSALCKLYGLRPSIGRISYRGFSDTFLGQEAVRSNAGPMGKRPQDLAHLMSAYMASKPWEADPDVLPIPWREEKEVMPDGPLCFAVAWGDELVTPHPPLLRGLEHLVNSLRAAGHQVVEWRGPLGAKQAGELMIDFWTADGGEDVRRNIEASGEPLTAEVAELLKMRPEDGHKALTVFETWQNQHTRRQYAEWFNDTWHATASYSGTGRPIDGLIMPTAPFVARPHGAGLKNKWNAFEHTYSNIQPLLDLSSGAFPTGLHQDPTIDKRDPDFKHRSPLDQTVHDLYNDPHEWNNSPIGLQIFGRRLEEEKILGMMSVIQDALFPSDIVKG